MALSLEEWGTRYDGTIVCLYPSLSESVLSQTCDRCGDQMRGRKIAKVIILDQARQPIGNLSTDWLHRECAIAAIDVLLQPPRSKYADSWISGTQRQMILFIQRHSMGVVETNFKDCPERPREKRYQFRFKGGDDSDRSSTA
jgi:hypothetical protein